MGIKGSWKHDVLGLWMLIWSWCPAVAAIALAAGHPGVWTIAIALLVVSARQHALFVVAHESWHKTLFRAPRLGRWAGRWLAAYPALIPWSTSRENHLEHHRKVGTSEDPDRYAWDWSTAERWSFVRHTLLTATGIPFLWRNAATFLRRTPSPTLVGAVHRGVRPATSQGHRSDHIAIGVTHAAILAVFALTVGYQWYFALWLFPAIGPRIALDETRQFLEHRGGRLLVYRAGPIERFVIGPFNFHLHAFHHAFASEPWFELNGLEDRGHERADIGVNKSYLREFASFLRGPRRDGRGVAERAASVTVPRA